MSASSSERHRTAAIIINVKVDDEEERAGYYDLIRSLVGFLDGWGVANVWMDTLYTDPDVSLEVPYKEDES